MYVRFVDTRHLLVLVCRILSDLKRFSVSASVVAVESGACNYLPTTNTAANLFLLCCSKYLPLFLFTLAFFD